MHPLGLAVHLRSREIHRQQLEVLVPREQVFQQQVFQQLQQVLQRLVQVLQQQEQVQVQEFQQQRVLEFRLPVFQLLVQHRLSLQQLF